MRKTISEEQTIKVALEMTFREDKETESNTKVWYERFFLKQSI